MTPPALPLYNEGRGVDGPGVEPPDLVSAVPEGSGGWAEEERACAS